MSEIYYTAKEAMEVLEMKNATFYREVREGNIPYEIEPGKKRNMKFPKEAIDLHAKREKLKHKKYQHFRFVLATNVDIWNAIQNARRLYGDDEIVPYKKVLNWRDINNEMSMSMKNENDELAGYTTIMPLEEKVIIDVLQNKIREREIPGLAIKKWTDPKLSVYIASMAIVPSGDRNQDRERGSFLLRHTIRWAITLTHRYDIKQWYAVGTTREGQEILETLGFEEIASTNEGHRKGYALRDFSKPAKLLRMFIANVERNNITTMGLPKRQRARTPKQRKETSN